MITWVMKTLHHWFGVVFAAFFFIIALTGVWVTLAKYAGDSLRGSAYRQQVVTTTPAQTTQILETLMQARPEASRIDFPMKGRSVYTVYGADGPPQIYQQHTLDPLSPERGRPVTDFMLRVHINLLDPFGVGRETVVWTGLVGAFLAGLGILIFIPQWRAFRLSRVLHPREMSFRDMRRAHLSSGIVFAAFVFLFGISGWAIGDRSQATKIFQSFNGSGEQVQSPAAAELDPRLPMASPAQLAAKAQSLITDSRVTMINIGTRASQGVLDVRLALPGDLTSFGQSRVYLSRQTGEVLAVQDGRKLGGGSRSMNAMFSLHTGRGMGLLYQILIAFAGLCTAVLAVTGLLSYILKWRKKISGWRRRAAKSARTVSADKK